MHQGPPTNFGNSQPGNPTFFSPFANNLNAQANTNVGPPPTFSNPTGFPQQVPFTPSPVGPPPVYNPTTSAPPVYNPTVSSPPPVYNPTTSAPPVYNPTAYNPASPPPQHFNPTNPNPVSPPPVYNPTAYANQPTTTPPPVYNPVSPPPQVFNPQNQNVGTTAPPPVNFSPLSSISTGAAPFNPVSPGNRYPTNVPPQGPAPAKAEPLKSPRGNEQKINPSQIPSPTNMDPNTVIAFNTRSNVAPPPVTVPFTVVDDGNASPRFMRMTLYNIPTTSDIYKNCNAPLGFALQPLAELGPNEEPVPVVNFGQSGPIRCIRCKAYINPFVIWSNGGRQYQCRLCDVVNDVPKDYFSPIEPSGKRYDHHSRPELSKGVVDFVASQEYIDKPPVGLCYLFAIDVSYSSVSSGLLQLIINSLRRILNEFPVNNKIGIMTFDTTVHFYNLNPSLQNPQMLVVPDIDSVFMPLSEEVVFVKYSDAKSNIDTLLDKLPSMFANSKINDSAFGSAIEAAAIAMKSNGGRVIAFQSVLPNLGQGRLVKRDDLKSYGTDKERTLYTPTEGFYTTKVKEFVKNKVSVDVFLCPPVGFVDVATIGHLSRQTGGQVYFYPNFNVMKDGEKVQMDLIRNVTRDAGYDGLLRVRTGRGLGVVNHHGNFSTSNQIELELSGIHSETSIFVELKHEEKLDEKQEICIQAALLYTTSQGERRIRVFNMSLPVTSVLGNVFRNADLDAIMNYYIKSNIAEVTKTPMTTLRTNLVEHTVDVLYSYRKFCATSSSPGQLILPEALKLLPVFTLSLLKNAMMRPGTDVHPDERNHYLYLLYSLPPSLTTPLLYPRMYALHTLSPEAGMPDGNGNIRFPPLVRLSSELLTSDGAFLLEDGQRMLLWIGKSLSPSFASELLNQESYNTQFISLLAPNYDVPDQLSTRVHNLINSIRQSHRSFEPLSIVKQGEVGEMRFFTYLVEDKGLDTMNYVDFLCHVHRQIQGKL